MPDRKPRILLCPHCGAENGAEAALCGACHQSLVLVIGPEVLSRPPGPRPSFRLGSLMLLIALVAVFLGLVREEPTLGLLFLIVVPAFVHTLHTAALRRSSGVPMSLLEKLGLFFGSSAATFATLWLVGIASSIVFFGTYLVSVAVGAQAPPGSAAFRNGPVLFGLVLATLVALPVMYWCWQNLWRRPR